jgi:hypothetical protein
VHFLSHFLFTLVGELPNIYFYNSLS